MLSCLKSWRLDMNVGFLLRQAPFRVARKVMHRMRKMAKEDGPRRDLMLEDGLLRWQATREYLLYWRAFQAWELLFQERKMEEHLCEQRLVLYHHQQRSSLFLSWKRACALRLFGKVAQEGVKRGLFSRWREQSAAVVHGRKRRTLRRSLVTWRVSLRKGRFERFNGERRRVILSRIVIAWREKTVSQRESHQEGLTAINATIMRYYLQRWRVEAVVHRHRDMAAASLMLKHERKKKVRFSQDSTIKQVVFYDVSPLSETEAIV